MENGEISPSLEVPIDEEGNTLGLMQYIQEYNNQLDDAIKLEDDFVAKVRPPMIRVFQKKGLAMTDEQYLLFAFGSDIVTKGAMVYQLTKQNKKLIEMWKDQSISSTKPASSPAPATSPAPVQEEQSNEPKTITTVDEVFQEPEEFTAESMVSDMMGAKKDSKFENSKPAEGMPTFGDPDILKELDKLSKQTETDVIDVTPIEEEKKPAKRKRGRPRKNKK